MRQEKWVCIPLAEGRTGCRTWSIHTRWKTDLFWKDFQKTLSDNLAQICDLFLCCWNYNFSRDNYVRGTGRRGGCFLQEKVFWKENQTFYSRRLTEAGWHSIIQSCFVFPEQVRGSFVVNRGWRESLEMWPLIPVEWSSLGSVPAVCMLGSRQKLSCKVCNLFGNVAH